MEEDVDLLLFELEVDAVHASFQDLTGSRPRRW